MVQDAWRHGRTSCRLFWVPLGLRGACRTGTRREGGRRARRDGRTQGGCVGEREDRGPAAAEQEDCATEAAWQACSTPPLAAQMLHRQALQEGAPAPPREWTHMPHHGPSRDHAPNPLQCCTHQPPQLVCRRLVARQAGQKRHHLCGSVHNVPPAPAHRPQAAHAASHRSQDAPQQVVRDAHGHVLG